MVPRFVLRKLRHLLTDAGYVVSRPQALDGKAEREFVRRLLRLLDIDCVIDIGANRGQYHHFLRNEVGFQAQIVSAEPIPSHVTSLQAQARADPKWEVIDAAFGGEPGRATLNVMANSTFSSFLEPDHAHTEMFAGQNVVAEQVVVRVETVDELLPALDARHGTNRYLLKIDTQGYDLEVLRGARHSLSRIRAVHAEASIVPIYRDVPSFSDIVAALDHAGFALSGIYHNNPGHFPRLIDVNCMFVNRLFLPAVPERPV